MSTALRPAAGRAIARRGNKLVITRGSPLHRGLMLGGLALLGLIALAIPQMYSEYRVFQFTRVLYLAIAVLGLNLLTGFNGQISLGHSAFFGLGAYTAAVLIDTYELPYLLTIPAAAVLCFVVGFLFGIPALRLEGIYLALVTLALAVVFPRLVQKFEGISGGVQGLSVAAPEAPAWSGLADDQWIYYLSLAVTALMFLFAWNLLRGRTGRAIVAVRDNEIAAETLGIRVAKVKTLTFAYSAMYAGIAGALYTFVVSFVAPDSFTITQAISFLAAVVVGGVATISGAIIGALFIQFVPVWASDFSDALAGLIYGIALILVMFVAPGGAVGLLRKLRNLFVRVEAPRAASTPSADLEPVLASPLESAGADAWASVDQTAVSEQSVGAETAPRTGR